MDVFCGPETLTLEFPARWTQPRPHLSVFMWASFTHKRKCPDEYGSSPSIPANVRELGNLRDSVSS